MPPARAAPATPAVRLLHLLAPLALTLALFIATTLGWWWYADRRDGEAHQRALDVLWLEQTLQQSLSTQRRLLLNWAQDLTPPTPAAIAEFSARAGSLLRDHSALMAIELLDRDGRRVAGLPARSTPADTSAPGQPAVLHPATLPPLSDPLLVAALTRARSLGQPAYSRVIEQGAPLWVLAVPISDERGEHGSVLAIYDLDRLLEQEVPWWFVQRYDLQLVDRNNKRLAPRDGPGVTAETPHKMVFGPADSELSLWVAPHADGHPRALLFGLAAAVLLSGLLIVQLTRLLQRRLRERQAAQQALSDALRFRETIENSLLTGLVVFDLRGHILHANPALGRMLGLTHEMIVGQQAPFSFWPPARHAEHAAWHAAMLRGEAPGTGRALELQRADGSQFWAKLFVSPLVDGQQAPSGWMASLYDISAEREAARMARERDDLLQHTARLASLAALASGLAHELNQPLAAIANYAAVCDSLLGQQPPPLPRLQDTLARIGTEAQRAGQIIQGLRGFIQKREPQFRRHRARGLLDEPRVLLAAQAEQLQLRIDIQSDDDVDNGLHVEGDGVMLGQVLFNLLRNALEAMASAARPLQADALQVRISREDHHVVFRICDRGPGLAEPDKLFQAFYTTKPEGMGLGLAICRTVVEGHGGRLWAEPRPGGGACFCFRLPIAAAAAASTAAAETMSSSTP